MSEDEKQIEIKKRARRRLVGAAALAMLAIIVLPMVMDGEPKPLGQDIQVRIPPQTGENSVARAIDRPTLPDAAAGAQEQASPLARPVDVPVAPVTEAKPSKPESVPSPERKAAVAATPRPELDRAVTTPQPAAPAAPAMDDAARAAAILAGRSPDDPRGDGGSFVVQVGAYRDGGNATSLQTRLKSDGLPAYTERADDKTRVRVGPFKERADAESALARVRRMGLGGSVIGLK